MNKKILYPLLVLAIGLAIAYLLATNKPVIEPRSYQPLTMTVRVARVETKSQYLTVLSQGTVQPRRQSELIPDVSGRVVWISPSLVSGGSFAEGDVLLRIDDADYRTAVQRARATRDRADVERSFAADELKRLVSLSNQQLTSQSQLDGAKRAARVSEANLAESRAVLEQAQRDLERTRLVAPFDGVVRSEQVDIGQFVSRGSRIGAIYATEYVEVKLPISTNQLTYLDIPMSSRGQIPKEMRPPVTITADFGKTRVVWEGELIRAEAEIDARSRMIYGVTRLRSGLNKAAPIIPIGLFVQAHIRGRRVENVVQLPRSAIRDNQQVLVVDADNTLHFREVSILRLEHDAVLVDGGLKDGELVCISPLQTVVEGMHVQPLLQ
jgi:RND family efflux transporter MFP subunit